MKTSLFYLMDHYPDRSGPLADRYAAVIDQSVTKEQHVKDASTVQTHSSATRIIIA